MSSPIVNLKKTNMAPEKIIRNGTHFKSQDIQNNPRPIEEDFNSIIRNSVSPKEKLLLQMNLKIYNLEDQVKVVKDELTKAVELINRKDEEIEMLKEQLLLSERQQTHPHRSFGDQMSLENKYFRKKYDEHNKTIGNMSPRKVRRFYCKGDVIRTEDGNTNTKKKLESLYEEIPENISLNDKLKKIKPKEIYEDDAENKDIDELLAKRVDNYVENLSATSSSTNSCNEISNMDLEKEYLRLAHQISDMEKFLADYGMIWVGEKKIKDGKPGDRIIQTTVGFSPNFDKVIMIIGELNERVSSENHIKVTGREAKFEKAAMLNLTLYNDGMQLEDNSFRKYSSESVKVFFQDLEDGYYPAELKESHPEGVIFKVTDRRSVMFEDSTKNNTSFKGPGYVLGMRQSSDEEIYKKEKVAHNVDEDDNSHSPFFRNQDSDEKYISVDDSRWDSQKNIIYDKDESTKYAIENKEHTIDDEKKKIHNENEMVRSMENKITQTDLSQEFQNNYRSLETQTNETKVTTQIDSNPEMATIRFRDKIDITNITYHEASSSGPDIIREVSIDLMGSHSEPMISKKVPLRHTRQPSHYQSYGPHPQQARERNTCQMDYGDETNYYNNPGQQIHHQSYGTTHHQCAHQNYKEREWNSHQMNFRFQANNNAISESEETDYRKSFLSTEYENAYGQNAYDITTLLAKKRSKSPGTLEGLNEKYEHITIIGSNLDTQQMGQEEKEEADKRQVSDVSLEYDNEPVMTVLNKRISDKQIELTMKSYNGKQIFSAYLYLDDSINKIWHLTKLSSDEYEVAAADKILDLNVPLKNYNLNGDVSLNILKQRQGSGNKTVTDKKSLSFNTAKEEVEYIDSPDEGDIAHSEISRMHNDEEGYSS